MTPETTPKMYGDKALSLCLRLPGVRSVLDIGSGTGSHAAAFRKRFDRVVTIDHSPHLGIPDIEADFNEHEFSYRYDLVWACHVLEHQRNPGAFLSKIASVCQPGGHIAITVPPAKHDIVGGHVTIWNAGLLLYNMVLAGIDCSQAQVIRYGYNLSVIVKYSGPVDLRDRGLVMDAGDLEKLQDLFPVPMTQNTNGDFGEWV